VSAVAGLRSALDALIRDVPDFPEPGVVFKDITPLLADHDGFTATVDAIFSSSRMHAAFLSQSPDPDRIRRDWSHVIGMMRRDENRAELASAAVELGRNATPEAEARLRALHAQEKPEELSDDNDGIKLI